MPTNWKNFNPSAENLDGKAILQLPKVELHRHLELSFRPATLLQLAIDSGFHPGIKKEDFPNVFQIKSPAKDLASALAKFLAPQRLLHSEEILQRLTFEAIEDAWNEGIRILELRYAPTFISLGHSHFDFEKIHSAILRGVALAKAAHPKIAVGLICIVQRTLPLKEAEEVIRFAIDHQDSFVGLDLADDEEKYACAPFAEGFAKAKKAGLGITVHAGEANFSGSARSVMDAILELGADRIGHGVQIWRSEQALELVKSRQIPLELCPTSNWLTQAVTSIGDHPFRGLYEHGILTTINSDDPSAFGIDLVHEYELLSEVHEFGAAEFERMNDIAASASFISGETKSAVWPRPIKALSQLAILS